MLKKAISVGLLAFVGLWITSCQKGDSNPISAPTQTIVIGEYGLPENTKIWEYQFSDGSIISSANMIDLGDGKTGFLFGATNRDTTVYKGNSLIGYYYSNGMRIVFGGGVGILLEPAEIKDGSTYTATSKGYTQDYSYSVTLDVATKYKLENNITVGSKTIEEALYVELTLTIKDSNGNQVGRETTCEYRGKGLGTVKLVNTSGVTLKYTKKIIVDGNTAFTS